MDESMQAMQRYLDDKEKEASGTTLSKNKTNITEIDQDSQPNPAALAGATGGTAGLGTDKDSGGELGASTGEGVNGHVGGTGTETPA